MQLKSKKKKPRTGETKVRVKRRGFLGCTFVKLNINWSMKYTPKMGPGPYVSTPNTIHIGIKSFFLRLISISTVHANITRMSYYFKPPFLMKL